MLGGPDDGRTFEGPGTVPPPVLRIPRPRPIQLGDVAGPPALRPTFDVVECKLGAVRGRWVYVWPRGGA